ncbi:MAG: phosphoribosylformylglycinamidine synthase [Oligoflexia bacterium]|nr:phosphoribosylformylglycinamidine synthase [Oligoflexia bacterium]
MSLFFFQIIDKKRNKAKIVSSRLYTVQTNDLYFETQQLLEMVREIFVDNITDQFYLNKLDFDLVFNRSFNSFIEIAPRPEVTDDEGKIAEKNIKEYLNSNLNIDNDLKVRSSTLYAFEEKISLELLEEYASKYLANKLIHHIQVGNDIEMFKEREHLFFSSIDSNDNERLRINEIIDLSCDNESDEKLLQISQKYLLALDLAEMKAIRNYYLRRDVADKRRSLNLPMWPYDIELQAIAQTWSEHCKHKEFRAKIHFELDGEKRVIDSLFDTYIRKATEIVNEKVDFLVKVFDDNAGLVRVDDDHYLSWKVETHNSPSALDPYGGALTGILGVNRDAVATGIGGARPLFNTNVLCFAPADYAQRNNLLPGQMDPRRIMYGVVKGIKDGGNKMGIPTVNGSIVFDDRFSGKPLVFCGTAALSPATVKDNESESEVNTALKKIECGDLIISAGGRVGRDGIHGATFSSLGLDENSPSSAVQIGSPYTQKILFDFLEEARDRYLVKTMTDNGAGGLSSSIGELAQIAGGAEVFLEKVLLKYSFLKPWEIFLSESQERITLVVEREKLNELQVLAQKFQVEICNIGQFKNDNHLSVYYKEKLILHLDLEFLHKGYPQKVLEAIHKTNNSEKNSQIFDIDFNKTTLNNIICQLLSNINICSREEIIRVYDHEVKGQTILKSLMGGVGTQNQFSPQDAAVFRLFYNSYKGVAISNGLCPQYAELDPYQMSQGAFDENIRSIISVGGELPHTHTHKNNFWSVCDNFCLPNVCYDPQTNPDGKEKLGKLVQMCEGLFDMATFFNIPLTSGKDSMKNDFIYKDKKISIPPTILYSFVANIEDVRRINSAEFKVSGDLIYLLGETYDDELAKARLFDLIDLYPEIQIPLVLPKSNVVVPKVRKEMALDLYLKMMEANRRRILNSSHDLSDGGLVVALAESLFANNLGATINLSCSNNVIPFLFSESHSRFLVSINPKMKSLFESIFDGRFKLLGEVEGQGQGQGESSAKVDLKIYNQNKLIVEIATSTLYSSFTKPRFLQYGGNE